MFIYKRNGTKAPVEFDRILDRIKEVANYPYPLNNVDCAMLTQSVISQLVTGMTTSEIDIFTASRSASKILVHLEYETLASRILVNNHHKNTLSTFSAKMALLQTRVDENGEASPMLNPAFYAFVEANAAALDAIPDYDRDYLFDYFGFCTLYEQNYLLQLDGKVVERPQDMFLRVATFIHYDSSDVERALTNIWKSYDLMSNMYCIHASPTLFNAGLKYAGCISCYLASTDDSKEGIERTDNECMLASASCGGIAFSASPWRCKGSLIRSSNNKSMGVVPFVQKIQSTVTAFNQGGKRKGSLAVYLHMHHPDLIAFLEMRLQGGDETQRSRNTFIALWISDLFMRRVQEDGIWSFFDPGRFPELLYVYGKEYERLYEELETKGLYKSQMRAREVWARIYEVKRESGIPYMLSADQINRTSNHHHLGPIQNSNLCCEIVEYNENKDSALDQAETACCTLASLSLPAFVIDGAGHSNAFPTSPRFDYKKLSEVVGVLVHNLNNIIDRTYYPSEAMRRGNTRHRPIAIGVQGLADVFHKFKIAYTSDTAKELNKRIFETIYYSAISASSKLARQIYKETGKSGAYETFWHNGGCHLSKGIFNFELYGKTEADLLQGYDWETLRTHVQKFGTRNSLVVALMPTASTAQMFGNTEFCEPSINIGMRKVMSGEYLTVNKYFFRELEHAGTWAPKFVEYLKQTAGSIQDLKDFPAEFKERYKSVWEIEQRVLIDMAADRQPFVDQAQSMNLYFSEFNDRDFTASHFYGWKRGLKTLSYYIRQTPQMRPQGVNKADFKLEVRSSAPAPNLINEDNECQVCGA